MAERVVELWGGQSFGGGVAQKLFMFRDFATSYDVDVRLNQFNTGEVPLFYGGLPAALSGRQINDLGGREWTVMVPYSARAGTIINPGAGAASTRAPEHGGENGRDEPVLFNIGFQFRGETQKITQSIQTRQSAATNKPVTGAARTARNWGRAIQCNLKDGKMEVEGCDVLAGAETWFIDCQIPAIAYTGAYQEGLRRLLCSRNFRRVCRNANTFFGYAAGSVLIVDADISPVKGAYRQAKFSFAVAEERPFVTLSETPSLQLTNVNGWSHIWVTYEEQKETVGAETRTRLVPFEAYEEQVYETGDFGVLKLEEYRVDP